MKMALGLKACALLALVAAMTTLIVGLDQGGAARQLDGSYAPLSWRQ